MENYYPWMGRAHPRLDLARRARCTPIDVYYTLLKKAPMVV
jgi:hypothetical protein